jgi:hypothetical protein
MKRLVHFPKTRLSELVKEFGGAGRDDAVAGAQDQLESMRGEADRVIGESICALEAIAEAPRDETHYSPDQIDQMLARSDQTVTLAGTFGYKGLDDAARCLCDLLDGLRGAPAGDVPSVAVHVRTMRLLAPGSPPLPAAHQDMVLAELAKILTHHGFSRAADTADKADPAA